jgi:plastocyanin
MVRRALEMSRPWLTGCALATTLATLMACAPAAPGGSPATAGAGAATTGGRTGAGPTATGGVDPKCTKATKVKITKTGGTYAFSPARLTIERGAALAVTNGSGTARTLSASPDAGIVTSVVDRGERQVIQFPDEGTFTVRSAGAVLRLTVSGDSGCPAPAHSLTIVAAPSGGYAFEPAKVTVAATENFAVTNRSGTAQTVVCGQDDNGENSRLAKGETQLLALDEPGRYTCTTLQHSSAKVTITVEAD